MNTVITFSRESAGMIVRQCLPKIWQDRYGDGFTQKNLLEEFIRDSVSGYAPGEGFQSPNQWIGKDAFVMLTNSLGIATDAGEAERLVNKWLTDDNDRFQWPGADYYVNGRHWGCAGFMVAFDAETGFCFTVFSDV